MNRLEHSEIRNRIWSVLDDPDTDTFTRTLAMDTLDLLGDLIEAEARLAEVRRTIRAMGLEHD